jgi:hypothetical protein
VLNTMPSVFEGVVSNNFNKSFFNKVFDHSSKFAINWSIRITPELQWIKNYDFRLHWERVYKEELKKQKGFFIEGYEIHGNEKTSVGYFVANIQNKTLTSNVALSAKRKHSVRPIVTDLGMWRGLIDVTKKLGCNEFVWQTDRHGRIWKALKIIANKLDNEISFKEGDPFSEMKVQVL